jgi:pyruvate, water dikinase
MRDQALVLSLSEVNSQDGCLVGGKNSSLGEMIQNLQGKSGIQVPLGFATTIYAYKKFFHESGLTKFLKVLFVDVDKTIDVVSLGNIAREARAKILNTPFPEELNAEIAKWYYDLGQKYSPNVPVAVRSSASKEDMPDASFAGQLETFLNVSGILNVVTDIHKCMASCYTARNISYLISRGYDPTDIAVSVGIQKMVRSDQGAAGVMFTIDPESGFRNVVVINGSYGFGEAVVQGEVNPDEFQVFKPTLMTGFEPIIGKSVGSKEKMMIPVRQPNSGYIPQYVPVEIEDRSKFCLTNDEVIDLAKAACTIENHYSTIRGVQTPMDIEWAKDNDGLFIVQARPETVKSQEIDTNTLSTFEIKQRSNQIITGTAVGDKVGKGTVRVILNEEHMSSFQDGDILVTTRTDPDWEPIMKKASALITDQGGRTCHAAIIARELGVPAVVGCGNATSLLKTGQNVTVSCAEGETGVVYDGLLDYTVKTILIDNIPKTKTQILMNVGNPEMAYISNKIPSDGVGLARLEFIIANSVKIHPLALLNFEKLDAGLKKQVSVATKQYSDKNEYFVATLKRGIAKIAASHWPNPVIVRMSDFKSNEYAKLLGGYLYEPSEENPMIGLRGASRYYNKLFRPAFDLECEAYKIVRDVMGLTNVIPMIPFCRTVEEGKKVLKIMAKNGLIQGVNGLQVYMMVELPSNVWSIDAFSDIFDGFSIGSNDLTQLTLGLDRDSAELSHLFDEKNPAVLQSIKFAINGAKARGKKIGICGQAPSDYPDFCKFLVDCGIDSISLNEDSLFKTRINVAEFESNLVLV